MNTKIFCAGLGVLTLVVIGVIVFRNSQYTSKPTIKINTSTNSSPQSITSQTVQEYSDPAGFKFSYPDSVVVSSSGTTDPNVYSSLILNSASTPGKIIIEAVSSNLTSLDGLVDTKGDVKELKLADLAAKQYAEKGNVITLALDKGVLFTFTASSGGNVSYWNAINDKIITSFTFVTPTTTQVQSGTATQSTDSDVTFEGEETVE